MIHKGDRRTSRPVLFRDRSAGLRHVLTNGWDIYNNGLYPTFSFLLTQETAFDFTTVSEMRVHNISIRLIRILYSSAACPAYSPPSGNKHYLLCLLGCNSISFVQVIAHAALRPLPWERARNSNAVQKGHWPWLLQLGFQTCFPMLASDILCHQQKGCNEPAACECNMKTANQGQIQSYIRG